MLRTDAPRVAWALAVALALSGPGASARADAGASPDPAPDLVQQEATQREALMAAIGVPRCTQTEQCWAVPVGARPCGGPESYLPASRASAKTDVVTARAQALAATRRAQHQAAGRRGICSVLPEPPVRCDAATQRCVLVDASLTVP